MIQYKIRLKLKAFNMIDSISICRKLYGCGNGMQYTGAVLILMNKNVEKTVANRGSNRL